MPRDQAKIGGRRAARLLLAAGTVVLASGAAPAGEPPAASAADSPLVAALKVQRTALTVGDQALGGPAAEMLLAEARKNQFVMIGEDHGSRETPQFAAALYAALRPFGFAHIAVEAGPLSSEMLEQLARSGGRDAIEAHDRRYPFSLPFFMWREEADYLARAVTADRGKVKHVVWGVDQEFETSSGFHFDRLGRLATTEAQRAAATAMKERAAASYARMVGEHNPVVDFLMTAGDADFETLAAVFPTEGEAARTIRELRDSARIYQAWAKGEGPRSNAERAAMMRRHFDAYYQEAVGAGEKAPRVMMKMGVTHMMRGLSLTDVYDLGTYLPELAAFNGSGAFQVLIVGPKGRVNRYYPFSSDAADKSQPYSPTSESLGFDVRPLLAAALPDQWCVIDLRPLRFPVSGGTLSVDATTRRLIFGFDVIVIVPELHAATLVE